MALWDWVPADDAQRPERWRGWKLRGEVPAGAGVAVASYLSVYQARTNFDAGGCYAEVTKVV